MKIHAILFMSIVSACFALPVEWTIESGGNGHYYEAISFSGGTWGEANIAAEALGGHLATITSQAENTFVFNLAVASLPSWEVYGPWLGGYQNDFSQEAAGGWVWVTGEPFEYTHWSPNQPDNFGNQEHFLHFTGPSALWNDFDDVNGSLVKSYIVEYVPEPTTLLLLGLGGLLIRKR